MTNSYNVADTSQSLGDLLKVQLSSWIDIHSRYYDSDRIMINAKIFYRILIQDQSSSLWCCTLWIPTNVYIISTLSDLQIIYLNVLKDLQK